MGKGRANAARLGSASGGHSIEGSVIPWLPAGQCTSRKIDGEEYGDHGFGPVMVWNVYIIPALIGAFAGAFLATTSCRIAASGRYEHGRSRAAHPDVFNITEDAGFRAVGDSETKLACAIIRRSCNFSKEVKENV